MEKRVILNEHVGLMHGDAGEILVNFLKNQHLLGWDFPKEEGQLELVISKIIQTADLTFDNGICGIGWMVSYLNTIGILKVNIDDILEDMDDEVYKDTLIMLANEQPGINSYLGRVNYYQSRYFVSGLKRDPLRHFIHFECLKLLVNRLSDHLETLMTRTEINAAEMLESSLIIAKFSYLMDMKIGEQLFEESFYRTVDKSSEQLMKITELVQDGNQHIASLYLESSLILYLSAWVYGNPHWLISLKRIFFILLKYENNCEIRNRSLLIKDIFMKSKINLHQLTKLVEMKDGRYWLLFLLTNCKDLKFIN